ncbi:Oidioi.mRNA.OKI2018_I69.XSR.g16681.t1.cds [Oikopleura dioica]|uniref:Oidioi.mRNA.OKI2018_I69.XSR.g16681.t1.cds n=1 Tax=Oikopleura dioica TaxID=34765 RepID=A0ABN7SN94_OIKDI|nr:Oidioi.mRNA.OKI2018_I69.XSR.g16681.t1.cds [Oikopleura dioica]
MVWKRLKPDVNEILGAIEELIAKEDRYQLENSAKFRAVDQRVATYDEFKGIVDGSHLRALDRKEQVDSILAPNKHCWNPVAAALDREIETIQKAIELDFEVEAISTYSQFKTSWRRAQANQATRQAILLKLNDAVIFKDSCEPLDEICDCLASINQKEERVKAILASLQKSREFSLACAFLDAKSKATLDNLIGKHFS